LSRSQKLRPIIILYIQREVYDFEKVRSEFVVLFCSFPCPACQVAGALKKHASYWKYYYAQSLQILRCICVNCGVTHAIIPSFSLPGTSIGTQEAEAYLRLREQGQGRGRAARVFSGEKAMSPNHPAVLDHAFQVAVDRAKAIFVGEADERLEGIAWVEALTGETGHPMVSLNQYCLEHRVNGICLTRYSIHLFREKAARPPAPHNSGSAQAWRVVVDSW